MSVRVVLVAVAVGSFLAPIARGQMSMQDAYRRMAEREAAKRGPATTQPATPATPRPASRPAAAAPLKTNKSDTPVPAAAEKRAPDEHTPLLDARRQFKTRLVNDGTRLTGGRGGPAEPPPPGAGYRLVKIPAPVGNLAAYASADPADGKRHPAVIWLHGGFSGIGDYVWTDNPAENDQSPRQFRDSGFVVLAPSRRGENDNPGQAEFFYGEVDDTLAAIDYAARLPYVDPARIYVVGHSTGGTLAMLTALCTTRVRAAVSLGGCPNYEDLNPADRDAPFDARNPEELRLRSADKFVTSLKTPTWYFEGDGSPYGEPALAMERAARPAGAPFHAFTLRGKAATHFTIVRPVTRMLAEKLKADTGAALNLSVTPDEVAAAVNGQFHPAEQVRCVAVASAAGHSVTVTPMTKQILLNGIKDDKLEVTNCSVVLAKTDGGGWGATLVDTPARGVVFDAGDGLKVWVADEQAGELPPKVVIDMVVQNRQLKIVVKAGD